MTTKSLLKSLGKMQKQSEKKAVKEAEATQKDVGFSYFLGYKQSAKSKEREAGCCEEAGAQMGPAKNAGVARYPKKPVKAQIRAHSAIESAFFNEIKRQASAGL